MLPSSFVHERLRRCRFPSLSFPLVLLRVGRVIVFAPACCPASRLCLILIFSVPGTNSTSRLSAFTWSRAWNLRPVLERPLPWARQARHAGCPSPPMTRGSSPILSGNAHLVRRKHPRFHSSGGSMLMYEGRKLAGSSHPPRSPSCPDFPCVFRLFPVLICKGIAPYREHPALARHG